MKKAVITILGTAGCIYKSEDKQYKSVESKAIYLGLTGTEYCYHNTFPLILNRYSDKYDIVALYTKEARQAQENILLEYPELSYDFLEEHLIDNPNDNKNFFSIVNKILSEYDEVIFDVSHGFRHLPLLALISLVIENIEHPKKISKILFAQEVEQFKKYKFIDLKEYLDISNIAFCVRSFLSTYKVPDLELKNNNLYNLLKRLSIHLTSNQFIAIFVLDIPELQNEISENKNEYYFIGELLKELDLFLTEMNEQKNKKKYEIFIYFSEFFLRKNYLLHSATYLIEGLVYYIGDSLYEENYIDFDLHDYTNQKKIVALLRFNYTEKEFNFPHKYFIDINSEIFNTLWELREDIAYIRHNLAHINIEKNYENLEKELENYIIKLNTIVKERALYGLDRTENLKKHTVTYKLECLEKKLQESLSTPSLKAPKLATIFKKGKEKTLDNLTQFSVEKAKSFFDDNEEELTKLYKSKENRDFVDIPIEKVTHPVVKELKPKKKREKIIQTEEDKVFLKRSALELQNIFGNK